MQVEKAYNDSTLPKKNDGGAANYNWPNRAWHLPPNGPVHCMHIKGLDQRLGGVVLGAIIHYYDLIGLVFQVQQRMDRSHHRYRLIPCRYNNRNGHMIVIG